MKNQLTVHLVLCNGCLLGRLQVWLFHLWNGTVCKDLQVSELIQSISSSARGVVENYQRNAPCCNFHSNLPYLLPSPKNWHIILNLAGVLYATLLGARDFVQLRVILGDFPANYPGPGQHLPYTFSKLVKKSQLVNVISGQGPINTCKHEVLISRFKKKLLERHHMQSRSFPESEAALKLIKERAPKGDS